MHSTILAWEIPWTEEPGGRRESDTTERLTLSLSRLSSVAGTKGILQGLGGAKAARCRAVERTRKQHILTAEMAGRII